MKFVECNLLVNEQTVNNFNIFHNICEDQFSHDNTEYIINCEIINQNIFWIYARFGKINPYSNEIFDIETKKSGKNPKQKKQVELNKQLFCIYDLRSLVLYMSDFRKQNFLSFYLKEKFGQNFLIKKYFIKPEEFIETITSIEKISFTFKKNVFTSDIFSMVEDELGYGATECFSLETKISKESVFDSVRSLKFLLKAQKMKDNHQIEKMKCIGKNDDGVESIFNLDSYLKKIEFNLELDDNGIYDVQKVKNMVLRKINFNQG